MPIPPTRFFITKKIYHSFFVAGTWQHFIDLLKRKNPRFTAFLDSNSARPVRRLPPALGTGAGPALHCEKTLTYLQRAYVSVYRYSLEVFPVSSLE